MGFYQISNREFHKKIRMAIVVNQYYLNNLHVISLDLLKSLKVKTIYTHNYIRLTQT